jgi:cytochrome c553
MKHVVLGILLSVALIGCSDQDQSKGKPQGKADLAAGKAIADQECKACHGLDGKGTAPGIPHLAGQSERYLVTSLTEYKQRARMHAALREIATHLTDAELRNVSAYYASLPPVAAAKNGEVFSPYENGKVLAAACTRCHGENGNSKTPGTPTLAGQQPRYLVVATQEYLNGIRETSPMHALVRDLNRVDLESIALYFASQAPAERGGAPVGDAKAGEPKTALCGGCHGAHGVSTDSATPTLAAQDAQYLVRSTKAYLGARKHESMKRAVSALSDADIENIAAFYTVQKSKPAESGQRLVQDITDKCNRCHGDTENGTLAVPRIKGQDRDYLMMALRSYRDDRRESSVMHKMSLPYGDAVIEAIASMYASQPAK